MRILKGYEMDGRWSYNNDMFGIFFPCDHHLHYVFQHICILCFDCLIVETQVNAIPCNSKIYVLLSLRLVMIKSYFQKIELIEICCSHVCAKKFISMVH